MVQRVPVLQAVVLVALLADHLHHLLLLAAGLQALVGEDLRAAVALRGDPRGATRRHPPAEPFPAPPPPPELGSPGQGVPGVPTLRWRCAGSDLQSRSMCSPTTASGISPRRTGTGVLHSGHTGTCTSCGDRRAAGAPGFGTRGSGGGGGGGAHLLVGGGALVLGVRDVVGAEDPLAGVALEGQEICGTRGRRSAPRLPHGPHPAPRCRRAPRPPALTQALAGGPRAVSPQVRELHGGPLSRSPAPRPFPSRRHAGRGRGRHHPRGGHGAAPRSRQRAAPGATPPLLRLPPPDPPPSSRSGSPHPGVLRSAPPARPKPAMSTAANPESRAGGKRRPARAVPRSGPAATLCPPPPPRHLPVPSRVPAVGDGAPPPSPAVERTRSADPPLCDGAPGSLRGASRSPEAPPPFPRDAGRAEGCSAPRQPAA